MTKKVEIHNADSAPHPLIVRVYDQALNGERNPEKDRLVGVFDVSKTGQVHDAFVFPGRYIIVSEG